MNKEILLVVDAVSNERGVDKNLIFDAIEAALATAVRKRKAAILMSGLLLIGLMGVIRPFAAGRCGGF